MLYVYRPVASDSATALAKALEGRKISKLPEKFTARDLYICWGAQFPHKASNVLNGSTLRSKLTDIRLLTEAKVPTLTIVDGPGEGRIGRVTDHQGGLDLITPVDDPDYYVQREEFVNEFRVHSFLGRSILAGIKKPRRGFENPHPWIKSWNAGWRVSPDGTSIRQKHRDVAHAAVDALSLDFGAVDIGERADGTLCVLEVNRAPGIEYGTTEAYTRAIKQWSEGTGA